MTSSSDLLWPLYLYYLTGALQESNEAMQSKFLAQACDIMNTQNVLAYFYIQIESSFPGIVLLHPARVPGKCLLRVEL